MASLISDKIVHYGAFKEALDKIVDIMRSEYAGSVIIRGNPGSGKKTLISEARNITGVKCVLLSSAFYNEDYTAMKSIVTDLGFKTRGTRIADLMDDIKTSAKGKEKLVIVLVDFEEFCRKRQSLLYNLMNLIHTNPNELDKGLNLTLIGLTATLDWAENIEKRVRSRLNAKCIDLTFPYQSSDEFVEFASELMGGIKIDEDLSEHLKYIYNFSNRSIRTLKKYLYNITYTGKKGKLKISFDPESWSEDYQFVDVIFFRERLRYLTRPQLTILLLAVSYCDLHDTIYFTLLDVHRLAQDRNYKFFDLTAPNVMKDTSLLMKLKLLKPAKADQVVNEEAVFYPASTPKQLKATIEGDHTLQFSGTDVLWRKLRSR